MLRLERFRQVKFSLDDYSLDDLILPVSYEGSPYFFNRKSLSLEEQVELNKAEIYFFNKATEKMRKEIYGSITLLMRNQKVTGVQIPDVLIKMMLAYAYINENDSELTNKKMNRKQSCLDDAAKKLEEEIKNINPEPRLITLKI